jgi:hypothetical protein
MGHLSWNLDSLLAITLLSHPILYLQEILLQVLAWLVAVNA